MRLLFALLCFCSSVAPLQAVPELAQQRLDFQHARAALRSHDVSHFQQLYGALAHYPLQPYLSIWRARQQLDHDRLVGDVLARFGDVPEAWDLRRAWVIQLAKRHKWQQLDAQFRAHPYLAKQLPETDMLRRWHAGQRQQALAAFSIYWQQHRRISHYIRPLYHAWQQAGHPTLDERWARVNMLARARRWAQVAWLARPLPAAQRAGLMQWRTLQRYPQRLLQQWPKHLQPALAWMICDDVIRRLSWRDPAQAYEAFQQLLQRRAVTPTAAQRWQLQRGVALRAAKRHDAAAAAWLAALPEAYQTPETRAWRARLALLADDWAALQQVVHAMPAEEQQLSRWRYWLAMALQHQGAVAQCRQLLQSLAGGRGYYSFLAAETLGRKPRFSAQPLQMDAAQLQQLRQRAGIQRAHEWLMLGYRHKAAREWQAALTDADQRVWGAAAALAGEWQWHDQVIRALFHADQLDVLRARFPLAYGQQVAQSATESGLAREAVWSIIRQESAFNAQARSYVGARGLMQLMPKTARRLSHQLGMRSHHLDLYQPALNIRLGAHYLAHLEEQFGSLALAAAAYNAGPDRVRRWLSRSDYRAPAVWVETIPFRETRRYVQQVMAFMSVYQWRQGKPTSSLVMRLSGVRTVAWNRPTH